MRDANWERVREEFQRIFDAPPDLRSGLIAGLDATVRAEVESLFRALDTADSFLEIPGEATLGPGASVGAYRLLEEIGRGGMGVVFRAERFDGETRSVVAIKFASGGMLPEETQRRFIQERQILAQLNHPHIVRYLDGGLHQGQRYLVMELAEGRPLDRYCAENDVPVSKRLALFIDLCGAVAYAHDRLILHRDLKPGNVLVNADGVVKVLDFGIARLLEDSSPDGQSTFLKPFSQSCASPEQFRGEVLTLSSDVYSLGVLLYEILTGVNPQSGPGVSFAEAYQKATEGDPKPPSSIRRELRGDLDSIVLKAMAREPERRYESVAALAGDVRRYLDGLPVQAVPPSLGYHLRRFMQRKKGETLLATALLALVAVGASMYVAQIRRDARRFDDARRLIRTVVFDVQPELEQVPATLPLRRLLLERSLEYLEAISRDAGSDPALLREIASAYIEAARIQGNALYANLGDSAGAKVNLAKAQAILERATAADADDPEHWRLRALLFCRMSEHAAQDGARELAFQHASVAVSLADHYLAAKPRTYLAYSISAAARFNVALTLPAADWRNRVKAFEAAAEMYQLASERDSSAVSSRRSIGNTHRRIGEIWAERQQFVNALIHATRAVEISQSLLASHPRNLLIWLDAAADLSVMGEVYEYSGRQAEAVPYYRRAVDLLERAYAADPQNARIPERLAIATRDLANMQLESGAATAAAPAARRATELFDGLDRAGNLAAIRRPGAAFAWLVLGEVERSIGNMAAACEAYREAAERFEKIPKLPGAWKGEAKKSRDQWDRCRTGR